MDDMVIVGITQCTKPAAQTSGAPGQPGSCRGTAATQCVGNKASGSLACSCSELTQRSVS